MLFDGLLYTISLKRVKKANKMKSKMFLFTVIAVMSLAGCASINPGEVINEKEVTSITLNETSKNLVVDDTFQLIATVLPSDATNKDVTWNSSNSDVASIDTKGMVTALKAGNTTVTVTSNSKNTVKATCYITVSDKNVEVSSITLNETSKEVTEGDSFTLVATVLPTNASDRTVKWTSSNTDVATVNNGAVTTLKEGSAVITATSNSKSTVKATCTVTVNAKQVPPAMDGMTIIPSVVTSGTSITSSSFTYHDIEVSSASVNNVYGTGEESMRLGSSSRNGSVKFTFANALIINKITVTAKEYGSDSGCQLKVSTSAETTAKTKSISNSSYADYEYSFTSQNESTWLQLENSGSRKRVIVSLIKIEAEPLVKIYPSSISLENTDVNVGSAVQLTPTFTPSDTNQKSVTWDSSDKSVATVSSTGLVTGLKAGTTTITATGKAEDGSDVVGSCTVTVKNVSVSGVSLSQTTLNISVGKEKTLEPTISPSNATNKNVTWKSNNTSIATVTNGVVKGVSIGSTTITVTTEDGNKTATCAVTVSEQVLDDWTLLFYICGADLESDSQGGYATSDINEILSKRTSQPDSVKIVVETGGASSWDTNYVDASKLERFEINSSSNKMIKKQSLAKASMGKPETLQSFLEWGFENYPAERYGLFMWNHGGAMDGCCFDENFGNDSLYADEVDQAVTAAKTTAGITENLEFIAYDACLMAVQDVAEWNSRNFNYMICSQESEYGGGYDYDAWLPTLYSNPSGVNTVTLLSKIGDTFMDYYEAQHLYDQTQSVLDLSKMAAYKEAWEDMAVSLTSMMTENKWNTFTSLVNKAKKFGQADTNDYNDGYVYDIFDAKGALTNVKGNSTFSSLSSQIDTILSILSEMVVYERHGSQMSGSNGLCMFCPISGYNQTTVVVYQGNTYTPCYSAERTNFKKWQALCAQYGEWWA